MLTHKYCSRDFAWPDCFEDDLADKWQGLRNPPSEVLCSFVSSSPGTGSRSQSIGPQQEVELGSCWVKPLRKPGAALGAVPALAARGFQLLPGALFWFLLK